MSIEIRPMTPADWPSVSEIYQQEMDTNLATFQSECPSYAQWDCSHLQHCRLVVTVNNVVSGWAALSPVSSRCVYSGVAEVSIYILPSQQGKGLGKQLLQALILASEQAGIWTLQSGIMQDNPASIRLHETCGFRMVGYRERIGKDRFGVWRNTVLMERRSAADDLQGGDCSCSPR